MKDEPDEAPSVKKDEDETDEEATEPGPNQEDSDIRDMRYKLEKLGCCSQILWFPLFPQTLEVGNLTGILLGCQLPTSEERPELEREKPGCEKHHICL